MYHSVVQLFWLLRTQLQIWNSVPASGKPSGRVKCEERQHWLAQGRRHWRMLLNPMVWDKVFLQIPPHRQRLSMISIVNCHVEKENASQLYIFPIVASTHWVLSSAEFGRHFPIFNEKCPLLFMLSYVEMIIWQGTVIYNLLEKLLPATCFLKIKIYTPTTYWLVIEAKYKRKSLLISLFKPIIFFQ